MFIYCKVYGVVKVGSGTPLADLSFLYSLYPVRVVRVANIRVDCLLGLFYSHVLRAYSNFKSNQAISITLFGPHPNIKTPHGTIKIINNHGFLFNASTFRIAV